MKLSIIIAHYLPEQFSDKNPLIKTIENIKKQSQKNEIEIIIADDGSSYTGKILDIHSKKIEILNDERDVYYLEGEKLEKFKNSIMVKNDLIKKWVYLPKIKQCMSKARITNYAATLSKSDNLFFLDDDNYFLSDNSINEIINLFEKYDFIVGQIMDNNKKVRKFSSNRVQGTTLGIKKNIFKKVGGLGTWTENFSCGVDSDLWMKLYNYFIENKNLKACYTNKISTYDSYSKRWKKFTKFLQDFKLKKEFDKLYDCKNYKSSRYNYSRKKSLWMENLIE